MKITHEDRFGEVGLFRMFNVETDGKGGNAMSSVRKPLWGFTKRKLSRGEKCALQSEDMARSAVRVGKPGSQERIAAYANAIATGQLMFEDSYADEGEVVEMVECDELD